MVGNSGVDQLLKFNNVLTTFSNRQIDGIVLTKFDTVDDKVGAALTMSFCTKKPIYFVGTGQTYTDLRRFDAASVSHALLLE